MLEVASWWRKYHYKGAVRYSPPAEDGLGGRVGTSTPYFPVFIEIFSSVKYQINLLAAVINYYQ